MQAAELLNALQLPVLVWFLLAVVILDFFDISLPRGDTLGVSGALHSAALVILGPLPAVLVGVLGSALAFVARRTADRSIRPAIDVPALCAGFAAASGAHLLVGLALGEGSVPLLDALLTAGAFLGAELTSVQLLLARHTGRAANRLLRGNLHRQAPLLGAQVSATLLAVIIFPSMGVWTLALVLVLLLLIRQSYALLLEIRETYRKTVEVLVEAAEGTDPLMRGHAERTAQLAREIGAVCGLTSDELDRVNYAALLHDLDALAPATDGEQPVKPSAVLADVQSFDEVAKVLKIFEGESVAPVTEAELTSAYLVALASDIDSAIHPQVHGAHPAVAVHRLAQRIPSHSKAKVVSAALELGHSIPAVS